jgi:N-acyl-D-aspartate/D-glutamate deacylase
MACVMLAACCWQGRALTPYVRADSVAGMPRYDLLIRNGTVVDGTGAPGVRADVGISRGRIAAVGALADAEAARVIDAAGRVVAPGFIDVHSHDDAACLTTPLDFKLMQGVTTDVVGNCGAGVAPAIREGVHGMPGGELILGPLPKPATWMTFGEYMDAVEQAKPAINIGCFVPHGIVRFKHLSMERRAPLAEELASMEADVDEGMAAGALGLSTGLIYQPGTFAKTDEVIALAKVAAHHGGMYMSHIRNEAEQLMEAVEEAIKIGREADVRVQVSHHKAAAPEMWGKTADTIRMIEAANDAGGTVAFDVYPYTAGSTILAAAQGVRREVNADEIVVASTNTHREYEGKTLRQIGEMLGVGEPLAIVRRILSEEPTAVAIFHSMHEDDVRRVVSHPLCMVGSDGIPTPTGKPHPRLYGTFPRVLQRYVREERLMSLEESVRKMTSLPADAFKVAGRGRLVEGAFADIIIFDPVTIADVATYDEPRQYPAGIDYVIVNGVVAAEGGRQVETHAGRLIRRGAAE